MPSIDGNRSKATSIKFDTPVSGGAYQNIRKVTIVWNDACNIGSCLSSDAESTNRNPAPFSSISFPAQGKRYGRRRRVRNDHDGTNPCKQGFLSSVLVSSFPNRKLYLRFGFFYANLRQPLRRVVYAIIGTPAPLRGEPWEGHLLNFLLSSTACSSQRLFFSLASCPLTQW